MVLTFVFVFIFGLAAGSFLNCLIFRLRKERTIWRGRSVCPYCQNVLRWFELIPVLSFFLLKGRCRNCQKKIDWQYPLVEIGVALLFLLILNFQIRDLKFPEFFVALFVSSVLIALFVYDLRYQELPLPIILPALLVLFVFELLTKQPLLNFLAAAAVAGGFFAWQYFISKGRWIGGGDVYLGTLLGLWTGWPNIILVLFLAYLGGALVGLLLVILKKKTWQSAVPFGIFLIPAALIVWFWGEKISRFLQIIFKI